MFFVVWFPIQLGDLAIEIFYRFKIVDITIFINIVLVEMTQSSMQEHFTLVVDSFIFSI